MGSARLPRSAEQHDAPHELQLHFEKHHRTRKHARYQLLDRSPSSPHHFPRGKRSSSIVSLRVERSSSTFSLRVERSSSTVFSSGDRLQPASRRPNDRVFCGADCYNGQPVPASAAKHAAGSRKRSGISRNQKGVHAWREPAIATS